jgi:hypothetical protein
MYKLQASIFGVTLWGAKAGLLIQGELEYTTFSASRTGEVVHAKFQQFP